MSGYDIHRKNRMFGDSKGRSNNKEIIMIAFEITINGVKKCTAGVDAEYGVLTSILTWAKRDMEKLSDEVRKKVPEEELKLTVAGLRNKAEEDPENLKWLNQTLGIGDEIQIKIINTDEVDPPEASKISKLSL